MPDLTKAELTELDALLWNMNWAAGKLKSMLIRGECQHRCELDSLVEIYDSKRISVMREKIEGAMK